MLGDFEAGDLVAHLFVDVSEGRRYPHALFDRERQALLVSCEQRRGQQSLRELVRRPGIS